MRIWLVVVAALAAQTSVPSPHPGTFKVATWNLRSGMGIAGFTTTNWNSSTSNCTDRAQPMNAWGMGLPQPELLSIKNDPAIVAMAIQEAWHCASPQDVNRVLGFKTASREEEGTGLLARYGFAGAPHYQRIDPVHNRWVVGGNVCLDAACSVTVAMFSTHFGGASDNDFPGQAQHTVDALRAQPPMHLFMGDLNLFRIDRWNPAAPCTAKDSAPRTAALDLIEQAGYTDAWKRIQSGEGWSGMASRKGCGSPAGSLYKRIDYVFSKGLAVRSIKRFAQPAAGGDAASDHAGLIAEFAWPAAAR